MRRGRVWWIQFREGGRRVRESLKTENRKLAEELRLRREVAVARRRHGIEVGAAGAALVPTSPAPGAAGRSDAATAPPGGEASPGLADIRAEYSRWSVAHKRPKTILNDTARLASP